MFWKSTKKSSEMVGLPPGTLVHIGEERDAKVRITIFDYDEKTFEEKEVKTIEEAFPYRDKPTVTWINIDGIHNLDLMRKVGEHFNLHSLILEDIVNTFQRPKIEDFQDHIFIVLKMLYQDGENSEIKEEQVSIIFGSNFVISFQEAEGDIFNSIRERIRTSKGKIRKMKSDYLAYSLIDAIADGYFLILEKLGEKTESLEDEVMLEPTTKTAQKIHNLKREMISLRKSIWPLREIISNMQRGESKLIYKSTMIYLRDVYDHTIQVIDSVETFRDMLSGMLDIYLSSISNRMNEVMKVLTIIATIFIPLTFIAGVYGMNFRFMPELQWKLGYPFVWLIMAGVAGLMMLYFRRKKWL
ncbi:MAG: magnesium/cobalt transporter CorA [Candidatus Omnitrophica bacterium]|nr:magnesium/cobalt transporter CorA [Candidatus Omnitrophota bacterium]MBU1630206.1 magnesium/cobalt transporter CorA [Candidatus Omnitrophota bacterium]MBU1888769.1 magnesium/cobalt transporter CorA [Candidatus Omnitrophota bacterium]